jgi:hypothetical protein
MTILDFRDLHLTICSAFKYSNALIEWDLGVVGLARIIEMMCH